MINDYLKGIFMYHRSSNNNYCAAPSMDKFLINIFEKALNEKAVHRWRCTKVFITSLILVSSWESSWLFEKALIEKAVYRWRCTKVIITSLILVSSWESCWLFEKAFNEKDFHRWHCINGVITWYYLFQREYHVSNG